MRPPAGSRCSADGARSRVTPRAARCAALVLSPTAQKNGGILDAARKFNTFKFGDDDVLELWLRPRLVHVAVYASDAKVKLKKMIAIDYAMPLAFLVTNLQTCFEGIGADEFVFQSCSLAADGTTTSASERALVGRRRPSSVCVD